MPLNMLWALGVAASYDAPLDRVLLIVGQHIFEEGHVFFLTYQTTAVTEDSW